MEILTKIEHGILTITFNREEKKNALTAPMYSTIADALDDAETNPAVRVILITGTATVFTAGNDLEEFLKNPPVQSDAPVFRFLRSITHAAKPIVAAVAGNAVGVGTTMLLHCDLVYAADNARFALPFTQLGLCPEAGSSLLLPMLCGYQRAAEKLLLGEAFSANEALQMGLVNKIVPVAELLPLALAQAAKLAALPPASIRITKQLMKQAHTASVDTRIAAEVEQFGAMLSQPAAREAFGAFLEKRKPDFSQLS
ncbi:enoyl-CoA hydratase [Herbaspirillum sp. RTI4]|uniref:enoyl-CoA hydratase n=1 Tax=Herbaspirillum sp. RTI4 TaxID=3048640 RepID=UPI002AB5A1D7|nr:enoyl-CoA hydratase [Herbaspirillum sp. RTI4]MDY7577115.1 enoyl-CoA hydratase [Herbaspirillum sp. RTI4]MEA9982857.1 enoyl-CoA hydratase [Herbaspirillum sp. RTI4]